MRLLLSCVVILLGLFAVPNSGRAQLSPSDPFSFYFGYVLPNQNRQQLAVQRSVLGSLNANVANLQAGVQADRDRALELQPSYLEELDPNAPLGSGRLRAASRIGAGFGSTRNSRLPTRLGDYYPDRRTGRTSNANVTSRGGR